jgi:hypothetical protein
MQSGRAWHRSQQSCCVDAGATGQSAPSFQSKPVLNVHFAAGGARGCFGLSALQEVPLPVVSERNASPATGWSASVGTAAGAPAATRKAHSRAHSRAHGLNPRGIVGTGASSAGRLRAARMASISRRGVPRRRPGCSGAVDTPRSELDSPGHGRRVRRRGVGGRGQKDCGGQ